MASLLIFPSCEDPSFQRSSLVRPDNLLTHCWGAKCLCGASMALVEDFPEKLGGGFANTLVKGKAGLLISLYLLASSLNCPASHSLLQTFITSVFRGHWEGNNGTGYPCSPSDPLTAAKDSSHSFFRMCILCIQNVAASSSMPCLCFMKNLLCVLDCQVAQEATSMSLSNETLIHGCNNHRMKYLLSGSMDAARSPI